MTTGTRLAAALIAYHNAIEPRLPLALRPPAATAVGIGAVALVRRRGVGWDELGLTQRLRGLRWGLVSATAAALGAIPIFASPRARRRLRERRLDALSRRQIVFHLLVRIPITTAIAEELAFRGALHGLLARESGRRAALVGTSVAFGLWHVAPALARVGANRPDATATERIRAVTADVVATTVGGIAFGLLRERSGGIVAPAIVHWAANALATIVAAPAMRRAYRGCIGVGCRDRPPRPMADSHPSPSPRKEEG